MGIYVAAEMTLDLSKKAKQLVGAARIVAVSSTTALMDRLPAVSRFLSLQGKDGIGNLDLYLTVACVGVGLMTADLEKRFASEFFVETMAVLQEFNQRAPRLLGTFLEEALKGLDDPAEAVQPIGFWVLRQIGLDDSSSITKDDIDVIGGLALMSMAQWV